MNLVKNFKDKNTIQEEAAYWIIQLDKEGLSAAEQEAFTTWLNESLRHKIEFIELAKVWDNMDVLAQVAECSTKIDKTIEPNQRILPSTKFKAYYRPLAVAAVFILFCFTWVIHSYYDNSFGDQQSLVIAHYSTAIGELRKVVLADGSTMTMNTNSLADISFNSKERIVHLQQGEANFTVAKDPQRPFIVYVGDGSVTAIGTIFNVKYTDDVADVIVSEGRVSVASLSTKLSPLDIKASEPLTNKNSKKSIQAAVSAGQKISFGKKTVPVVKQVEEKRIAQELSWQTGMLLFEDTPLKEVIHEVSRYTRTKIIIQDHELAALPVAGYFKAGETKAMLEVLQISFGIKVTEIEQNYIVLSKNDDFIKP